MKDNRDCTLIKGYTLEEFIFEKPWDINKDNEDNVNQYKGSYLSEYIGEINKLINRFPNKNECKIVYRGENDFYNLTACVPNIYRSREFDDYAHYEKIMLNEMRANKLVDKQSFLKSAMDAQHGGFPSRLLDISFNSFIAAYFGCADYVLSNKVENKIGEKDGYVYIFAFNSDYFYSAEDSEIWKLYEDIINADVNDKKKLNAIYHTPKLISGSAHNKRLSNQQGGFVLFGGYDLSKIPFYSIVGVVKIDKSIKKDILNELDMFLGINDGFIYPEITTRKDDIIANIKHIKNYNSNIDNEINLLLQSVDDIRRDLIDKLNKLTISNCFTYIKYTEEILFNIKKRLQLFYDENKSMLDDQYIIQFNDQFDWNVHQIDKYIHEHDTLNEIGFSINDILINR